MATNATKRYESDVSNDNHDCLLCNTPIDGSVTRTLHVRQEGGAAHGLIEAKGHICMTCLEETNGWVYNQVQQ